MASRLAAINQSVLDHIARDVVTSAAAPAAACAAGYRQAGQWVIDCGFFERNPDLASREGNSARLTPYSAECLPTWDASAQPSTPTLDFSPSHPKTIVFDLASVTKPLFATAAHIAAARGTLDLQARVTDLLPWLDSEWAAQTTLESLLSHRSGLLPHVELFDAMRSRRAASKKSLLKVAAESLAPNPGSNALPHPAVYSDLGYIVAGAAIEAAFGVPLDDWFSVTTTELDLGNVGSARQWHLRAARQAVRFMPTETVAWRGGSLVGVVHDENAWAISGHRLSGHAGLFATAEATACFGTLILDSLAGRPSPVPTRAAIAATARRSGGTLCCGFDRLASSGSAAGSFCSAETFGHLGFTGTSLWCDPERGSVVVLLTNRVCPSRHNLRIRDLRPAIHDRLFRWAAEHTRP